MQVGCVQYFLKHKLLMLDNELRNTQQIEHIFAYVIWRSNIGTMTITAVQQLCVKMSNNSFNLIPAQRIAYRCAYLQMEINFDGLDETIFVACPLLIQHSI